MPCFSWSQGIHGRAQPVPRKCLYLMQCREQDKLPTSLHSVALQAHTKTQKPEYLYMMIESPAAQQSLQGLVWH